MSLHRENLRILLLTIFEASKPFTVELRVLRANLPKNHRSADDATLLAEIDYLKDKAFIHEEPKVLSPENRAWKISAVGRDFLASEGLA
jgi:hypothetical protein